MNESEKRLAGIIRKRFGIDPSENRDEPTT